MFSRTRGFDCEAVLLAFTGGSGVVRRSGQGQRHRSTVWADPRRGGVATRLRDDGRLHPGRLVVGRGERLLGLVGSSGVRGVRNVGAVAGPNDGRGACTPMAVARAPLTKEPGVPGTGSGLSGRNASRETRKVEKYLRRASSGSTPTWAFLVALVRSRVYQSAWGGETVSPRAGHRTRLSSPPADVHAAVCQSREPMAAASSGAVMWRTVSRPSTVARTPKPKTTSDDMAPRAKEGAVPYSRIVRWAVFRLAPGPASERPLVCGLGLNRRPPLPWTIPLARQRRTADRATDTEPTRRGAGGAAVVGAKPGQRPLPWSEGPRGGTTSCAWPAGNHQRRALAW